ncbi:unnamed protein product [Trichobilharzia regenti]|nr:unnamed protein product [Trichobilharzia regenti]
MFGFSLSPGEIDAIIARYANDDGFNYLSFLNHLCPPTEEDNEYKYPQRLECLQKTNILGKTRVEMEPVLRDAEGVMDKLKAEVCGKKHKN